MPKQAELSLNVAEQAELSPNVPDIAPDYVDLDARPAPAPERPRPAPPVPPPEMAGEPPDYVDLECVHSLNAQPLASPETPQESAEIGEAILRAGEAGAASGAADAPGREAAVPDSSHRDGECIPNTPDVAPDLVSEERTRPAAAPAANDGEADSRAAPASPVWLRWSSAATALAVGAFGALVFSQVISSLALAATLPVWARYLLLIPLGLCCLAVLAVCAGLVQAWIGLRAVRQVDVAALEDLRRRAQTRKDGVEHFQAARAELENYLRSYPLEGDAVRRLRGAGMAEAQIDTLAKERDYLLGRATDSRSWLEEFRTLYQSGVDRTAAARIRSWALKAAGCVIASPLPLLDAALILGISLKMIKDLCVLYNVRSGRSSTMALLGKAVVVAFIAGVAEEATDVAADMASEELAGMFGESTLNAAGAGLARVVAPKLGEGAINAFFVRRLGRATVRLLQPLRP